MSASGFQHLENMAEWILGGEKLAHDTFQWTLHTVVGVKNNLESWWETSQTVVELKGIYCFVNCKYIIREKNASGHILPLKIEYLKEKVNRNNQ